jgi:ribonuclease VapC
MIVVDSSVLLSLVMAEEDAEYFIDRLDGQANVYIPSVVITEAGIIADQRRRGPDLDALLEHLHGTVVALDEVIARLARQAYLRYGRGSKSKARLNFGDCLVYATAKHLQVPLLFKGDEFKYTDIVTA